MMTSDPGTRATLVRQLVAWLEAERVTLNDSWRTNGIPPVTTVTRRALRRSYERTGERSAQWSFKFESTKVDVSRMQMLPSVASPLFRFSTSAPTESMVEAYGEPQLVEALVEHGVDDPVKRMALFLMRLCGDFLKSLDSVEVASDVLAAKVVESYLQFLERDDVDELEQLPIGGIVPPEKPIELRDIGITLRALTDEELGELGSAMSTSLESMLEASSFGPSTSALMSGLETCMLTTRTRCRKGDPTAPRYITARILLALEFLGLTVCTRGAGLSWREPGPRIPDWLPGVPFPKLPERGEDAINESTLRGAANLAEKIPIECFDKPRSREAVSLHRFALATSQSDDAEAVIDYVIALEALLAPGSQTEVGYRFAVNGARYLMDEGKREDIYRILKLLYDVRSKLVHGGSVPAKHDIGQLRNTARRLTAAGLSKAILHGWPTGDDFTAAALSSD